MSRDGRGNEIAILEASVEGVLHVVVACLRRQRVAYVLIGAWALSAWGKARATGDVDLLVLAGEKDLARLSDQLVVVGGVPDEIWSKWNPMLRDSQLRFQFQDVTVDILSPRDAHDRQIFLRKRRRRFNGKRYWVVSPEDFLLQKMKVGRPRDFDDALSVLERSGSTLDRRYLRRWAARLGILAELNYILSL